MSLDPYLELEHGVLRNRLGITDPAQLALVEAGFSTVRITEIDRDPVPGGYDLPHLQHVHWRIFSDVYPWAGALRTVTLGKGGHPFCPPKRIVPRAAEIFTRLAAADRLRGHDRPAFVAGLAGFLGEVNDLHPFREGNGRAQRTFFGQLARAAGYRVTWEGIDPTANVQASRAAADGDPGPLRELLDGVVTGT